MQDQLGLSTLSYGLGRAHKILYLPLNYQMLAGSEVGTVLSCIQADRSTKLYWVGVDPKTLEMFSVKSKKTQIKQNGINVGQRLVGSLGDEQGEGEMGE